MLSYTVSELIMFKDHPSKTGGPANLDFDQNTGVKFGSNDIDQMWIKSTN